MSINQFHDTADQLTDTLKAFVDANIDKVGCASWECQHTAAMNEVMSLSATLDGTSPRDLTDPQADHQTVFLAMDAATAQAIIEAVNIATMSHHMNDDAITKAQDATTRITDALVG